MLEWLLPSADQDANPPPRLLGTYSLADYPPGEADSAMRPHLGFCARPEVAGSADAEPLLALGRKAKEHTAAIRAAWAAVSAVVVEVSSLKVWEDPDTGRVFHGDPNVHGEATRTQSVEEMLGDVHAIRSLLRPTQLLVLLGHLRPRVYAGRDAPLIQAREAIHDALKELCAGGGSGSGSGSGSGGGSYGGGGGGGSGISCEYFDPSKAVAEVAAQLGGGDAWRRLVRDSHTHYTPLGHEWVLVPVLNRLLRAGGGSANGTVEHAAGEAPAAQPPAALQLPDVTQLQRYGIELPVATDGSGSTVLPLAYVAQSTRLKIWARVSMLWADASPQGLADALCVAAYDLGYRQVTTTYDTYDT